MTAEDGPKLSDRDLRRSTLRGRTCLVAGASRGVGRGIALGLGEAGARVIVTARSSEAGAATDGRPETIEEVAREVTAKGGDGLLFRCDHTQARELDQLAAYVRRVAPRLDLLVLNVFGGNDGFDGERYPDGSSYGTPFWRRPASRVGRLMETALYANLLTAQALAPFMVAAGTGLIIATTFDADGAYLGDAFHDLAMAATARLGFVMARDLAPHGVTALSLSPGLVRTERAIEAGLGEAASESPIFVGRVAAALAADADVARFAGQVLHAADLGRLYGVKDVDGSEPARYNPFSNGDAAT
ncbi:NAD(P)-dependent dehydrogenase, short-chain alcohol dehydrogenase family [Rhizobiales bacterium GAS113]|nr:NAD(P)-dependent dehydrogenase, short-chain alcohol dehydrogenase family [Rhizobiales bacterium GAS113]